jgi:predicted lysophospholipase L1 biosynthesis ABC-type transport system permease subunit
MFWAASSWISFDVELSWGAWLFTATGLQQMLTFFPYQSGAGGRLAIMCVAIRATGDPRGLVSPVRETLRRVDPSLAIVGINTVDEQLDDVLAQDRLLAGLAGFGSGLSALLACLGLYGIVSHMTARRTNEIGLRIALGAQTTDILRMFLREGVRLAVLGVVLGVPATLAITPWVLGSSLYGVGPHNPATIGLAAILIVGTSLVAAVLPARRAARIDPVASLRDS